MMDNVLDFSDQPEVLEIIENLLELITEREKQIRDLEAKLEKAEAKLKRLNLSTILQQQTAKEEKSDRQPTILIVDDCEVMQHLLKGFLTANGYKVAAIARDGEEAVRLYRTLRPSLVTMDINMPVMDGFEATKQIKEIDPDAKVVVISIELEKSTILKAVKCGADEYIGKPVQSRQFLRVVERILNGEKKQV